MGNYWSTTTPVEDIVSANVVQSTLETQVNLQNTLEVKTLEVKTSEVKNDVGNVNTSTTVLNIVAETPVVAETPLKTPVETPVETPVIVETYIKEIVKEKVDVVPDVNAKNIEVAGNKIEVIPVEVGQSVDVVKKKKKKRKMKVNNETKE